MDTLRDIGLRISDAIDKVPGLEVFGSGGPVDDSAYEIDIAVIDGETVYLTLRYGISPAAFAAAGADDEPRVEVVHACPPEGSGLTPCCDRTPFELLADRMTLDPALVTCLGGNE